MSYFRAWTSTTGEKGQAAPACPSEGRVRRARLHLPARQKHSVKFPAQSMPKRVRRARLHLPARQKHSVKFPAQSMPKNSPGTQKKAGGSGCPCRPGKKQRPWASPDLGPGREEESAPCLKEPLPEVSCHPKTRFPKSVGGLPRKPGRTWSRRVRRGQVAPAYPSKTLCHFFNCPWYTAFRNGKK